MITLFTDFGSRDAYVAQMKGVILGINAQVPLVDLTHEVTPFDIRQAAYLLEQATRYFPAGTITVAVIDPGVGTARRPMLLETPAGKWYVGPDNGLFTRIIGREGLAAAYELRDASYFRVPAASATFHGRDIFAPVAAHLSRGVPPERFGPPISDPVLLPHTRPHEADRLVCGEVIHIDHFGNVITNIGRADLGGITPGRDLDLTLGETTRRVPFCSTYGERPAGALITLINSDAAFEIAMPQGRASAALAARVGDRLRLTW
jgi:S-adenosylmethionine hydrolase